MIKRIICLLKGHDILYSQEEILRSDFADFILCEELAECQRCKENWVSDVYQK